jgi:riboflavin synthase
MFTGIIREVGEVIAGSGDRLKIRCALDPAVGASVAVNGVCLTVVEAPGESLEFDTVPETRARTNLGALQPGDRVNLEPALTLETPLDGHLVLGHVDATARVHAVRDVDLGREVTFEVPPELERFIAEKGSIAIDGTSLTVAGLSPRTTTTAAIFTVALIPHTLAHTIAGHYAPGTAVNLEVDVFARYAERVLTHSPH